MKTNKTKYRYITVNTNSIFGAQQAIAMKRNGWELCEIKDFWNMKFRKKIETK